MNDDGRHRVGLRNSGEEDSPCWSLPEMDMGSCLGLVCGSVVPLRYGPYRKTSEFDARPCNLDLHFAWA